MTKTKAKAMVKYVAIPSCDIALVSTAEASVWKASKGWGDLKGTSC